MVYCGIWNWYIMGFVQQVYSRLGIQSLHCCQPLPVPPVRYQPPCLHCPRSLSREALCYLSPVYGAGQLMFMMMSQLAPQCSPSSMHNSATKRVAPNLQPRTRGETGRPPQPQIYTHADTAQISPRSSDSWVSARWPISIERLLL